MHFLLEQYKVMVEFLGRALGGDYEVVLHDLSEGHNAIVAIANGGISGRGVGAPPHQHGAALSGRPGIRAPRLQGGLPGVSRAKTELHSSTMFIKDEAGRLIGMLCVNFDPAHCVQAANAVLALCGLPGMSLQAGEDAGASAGAETFVGSVPDAVRSAIEEVTGATGVPASRLTMEEKIRIVDALNQEAFFYLKGAR